jgi:prepilin-type N-terminal cleavage/methylation domain-containing protein
MRSLRRGHSLIELLAVLAVFSVTLSTIVLTLHALQKTGDHVRANMDIGIQEGRFAHQFRTDAHATRAFVASPADSADASSTVLQLTLPDQQIVEYRLQANRIERLVRSGDAVQQRESYRVRPVLQQGWAIVTSGSQPLVTVYLQRQLEGIPDTYHSLPPWRVDAVLGLWSPEDITTAGESVP